SQFLERLNRRLVGHRLLRGRGSDGLPDPEEEHPREQQTHDRHGRTSSARTGALPHLSSNDFPPGHHCDSGIPPPQAPPAPPPRKCPCPRSTRPATGRRRRCPPASAAGNRGR